MTERVRNGATACYMADGPKGPLRVAKIGLFATARDAGVDVVIPGAAAAWPVVRLRSWDRFQIPLPFAKVTYHFGEPIPIPPDATREQLEVCRLAFENELTRITDACDHAMGLLPVASDAPSDRPTEAEAPA